MPRLTALAPADAPPKARPLLENVRKGLGMVPNLMATLAHAPAALQAYLGFSQALGGGTLDAPLRERIALAVAGANSCGYCASAHTALGAAAGLPKDELARNLRGDSNDPRAAAAIDLALAIVAKKGVVGDDDLAAAREAGLTDGEIVEVVANVALNIFTNYLNHVADTVIDFPVVDVPTPATI
ncbi:MAG: peroxidase-related enzyme [Phycisphaerales bacterium]|nr:peroxidase-related enzyme [Phycisphaerales bacterium]